jgi:hypothetical protein
MARHPHPYDAYRPWVAQQIPILQEQLRKAAKEACIDIDPKYLRVNAWIAITRPRTKRYASERTERGE